MRLCRHLTTLSYDHENKRNEALEIALSFLPLLLHACRQWETYLKYRRQWNTNDAIRSFDFLISISQSC